MNANKQSSARLLAVVLAAAVVVCAFAAVAADVSAGDNDDETTPVTYYVASTGDDTSGTGASDAPFATVSKALEAIGDDSTENAVYTIVLADDKVVDTEVTIDTDVTIDLNKKTWTVDKVIISGDAVTIENGTVAYVSPLEEDGTQTFSGVTVISITGGTVVLDGVTVSVTVDKATDYDEKSDLTPDEKYNGSTTYYDKNGKEVEDATDEERNGAITKVVVSYEVTSCTSKTNGGIEGQTITGVSVTTADSLTFQNVKFSYSYTDLVTTVTTVGTVTTTTSTYDPDDDDCDTYGWVEGKPSVKSFNDSDPTAGEANTAVHISIAEAGSATFNNSSSKTQLVLEEIENVDVTMSSRGVPTSVIANDEASITTVGVCGDVTIGGCTVDEQDYTLEIENFYNGYTVEGDEEESSVTYSGGTVTFVGDVTISVDAVNTRTVNVGAGDDETAATLTISGSFDNGGTVNVRAASDDADDENTLSVGGDDSTGTFTNERDGTVNVYGALSIATAVAADSASGTEAYQPFVNYGYVYVYAAQSEDAGMQNISGFGLVEYDIQGMDEAVLGKTVVSDLVFTADQIVTVTSDVVISAGNYVVVQGLLVIPEGYTVDVDGILVVAGPGATIDVQGNLNINGDGHFVATDTENGLDSLLELLNQYVDDDNQFDGDNLYGFMVLGSGTVIIDGGTVSLQSEAIDDDEEDTDVRTMYLQSGSVVSNDGTLYVGDESAFFLDGTVRNEGTLTVEGKVSTSDDDGIDADYTGGIIYNWGLVTFGTSKNPADLESELEIRMMQSEAEVDVAGLTNLRGASSEDEYFDYSAYLGIVVGEEYAICMGTTLYVEEDVDNAEAYVGVLIPAGTEADTGDSYVELYGLTVTAGHKDMDDGTITTAAILSGKLTATYNEEAGDATFGDAGTFDAGMPKVALESGHVAVVGELEIGKDVGFVLYLGNYEGHMYVSGTLHTLYDNFEAVDVSERVVTVDGDGVVTVGSKCDLDGVFNAAAYDTKEGTTDVRVYTTLATALEDQKDAEEEVEVSVLGSLTMTESLEVFKNTVLVFITDSKVTVPYGYSLSFDEGSAIDGTADDGCGIIVKGAVYVADVEGTLGDITNSKSGVLSVPISSDVIVENVYAEGDRLYNNLKDALENAEAGQTVTLANDAVLEQDLTVKADVTLDLNGYDLYVNGYTLTVDGTVYSDDSGTVDLTTAFDEEGNVTGETDKSTLVIDDGGCICGSAIDNYEELAIASSCGYYGVTDKTGTTYYVETLADALADLADSEIAIDGSTVYFPGEGTEGDLTVTGGTLDVSGTLTADSVTLDNATLTVEDEGSFVGVVSDADGYVDLDGYTGTAASVGSGLTVSGEADGGAVYGAVTSGDMTFDTLVVEGTLTVEEGATLTSVNTSVYGTLTGDGDAVLTYTIVGQDADVLGADATLDVYFVIEKGEKGVGYVLASPGSTVVVPDDSGIVSTAYYGEDADVLWVTAYANEGELDIAFENANAGELVPPITNGVFMYWADAKGNDASDETVGAEGYTEVYAYAVYDIYTITIRADTGIADVYLNGNIMVKNGNGEFVASGLTADTYKITYALVAGYTGEAELKLLSGDATYSGFEVTLSGTDYAEPVKDTSGNIVGYNSDCLFQLTGVQSATGEGTSGDGGSSGGDDGMSLTDWLLIILVILILIIAIIVAYRLLRN